MIFPKPKLFYGCHADYFDGWWGRGGGGGEHFIIRYRYCIVILHPQKVKLTQHTPSGGKSEYTMSSK